MKKYLYKKKRLNLRQIAEDIGCPRSTLDTNVKKYGSLKAGIAAVLESIAANSERFEFDGKSLTRAEWREWLFKHKKVPKVTFCGAAARMGGVLAAVEWFFANNGPRKRSAQKPKSENSSRAARIKKRDLLIKMAYERGVVKCPRTLKKPSLEICQNSCPRRCLDKVKA